MTSVLLALRLPLLGKRALITFVRFVLVWFCKFPLPLGVWEGLRFVIVALPDFSLTSFFTVFVPSHYKLFFLLCVVSPVWYRTTVTAS